MSDSSDEDIVQKRRRLISEESDSDSDFGQASSKQVADSEPEEEKQDADSAPEEEKQDADSAPAKVRQETDSEQEEEKQETDSEPEKKRQETDPESEEDKQETDSELEEERLKTKKALISDSDDDKAVYEKSVKRDKSNTGIEDSDEEEEDKEEKDEGLVGKEDKERDDKEEEEEEGEEEDEEDDEEEERDDRGNKSGMIYDFDLMMARKKEENSRKRRSRKYEIINDNDDFIADIINQMKIAVNEDMEANQKNKAATKKLKQLPFVVSQLRKVDLREAFLDSDVLSVMTDWLTPLPDKSLPHLKIREDFLKILLDFNLNDVEKIKASAIGKAVMYLYKHPKETKENKALAKKLISSWSRPIFQLDSNFSSISREEREERDMELRDRHRKSVQRNEDSDCEGSTPASKKDDPRTALKPGDPGWIPRARVPAASMKDYVIRPRSTVEGDVGKSSRRPVNMLDKYIKSQQERRRATRQQRAVNMKIDRI